METNRSLKRTRRSPGFRAGRARGCLLPNEIAARGIDVWKASALHVINFELPNVPRDYVTALPPAWKARAGAAGIAISCCSAESGLTSATSKG